ncbi:MAG: DUF6015 family protein [Candidatus Saliniplasma sp.]
MRIEEFKKAVTKVLKDRDIEPEEAEKISEKVMNLFGYDKSITDNLLSSGERDLFYMLEDYDILTTEEETAYLPSGKRWRIHYWKIKDEKIREILSEEKKEEVEKESSIYDDISDDVWKRDEDDRDKEKTSRDKT